MKGFWLGCAWAVPLLLLSAVGCGDASDDGQKSGPVAAEGFPARFASSYCASIADCCSAASLPGADCTNTLETQLKARLAPILANPKIRYDESAAGACIDAYAKALRACSDRELWRSVDEACDALVEGTVPEGGACAASDECVEPAAGYVLCEQGACVFSDESDIFLGDGPRGKLGDACAGTCSGDETSLSCTGAVATATTDAACWTGDGIVCSTQGTCVAAPKVGEPCIGSRFCDGAGHCAAGVCVADSASGPCTNDDECLAPARCDFNLGQCVQPKANGEACDSDDECLGGDCYQDRCRSFSVATTASCSGLLDD